MITYVLTWIATSFLNHFFETELFRKAETLGKPVVIAGCVPQASPRMGYIKGLSLIGVQQIDRVVEVVEETLKGVIC